jgi:uncharacterized tellurite resistance protein B-like protein
MFDAIRHFVSELAGDRSRADQLDDHGCRLAAAALLVHAAWADGAFDPAERTTLATLLRRRFDLDEAAADDLIARAIEADQKAVDLYHFTQILNEMLDDAGRARIVEMMWQIAYADGQLSPFEGNLIWRVADLLNIASNERIALRQRVAAAHGQPS